LKTEPKIIQQQTFLSLPVALPIDISHFLLDGLLVWQSGMRGEVMGSLEGGGSYKLFVINIEM
jgi:hypothetical protein